MLRVALAALLTAAACADGLHPIASITWDETWGPCAPGEICHESVTVRADCTVSYAGPDGDMDTTLAAAQCDDVLQLSQRADIYDFMRVHRLRAPDPGEPFRDPGRRPHPAAG